jgi:hypothetical protein
MEGGREGKGLGRREGGREGKGLGRREGRAAGVSNHGLNFTR